MKNNDLIKFLRESNAIEGVYDDESLRQTEKAWDYIIGQDMLSIPIILKMHEILMEGKLPKDQLGAFRKFGVIVGGRLGAKWPLIPELMNNWILDANDLQTAPIAHHIRYERIHPFADGNGRTGRILMAWQLLKQNMPLLIIYEEDRWEYYQWFD